MHKQDAEREPTMVIASATELLGQPTRRGFLRTLLAGGSVVLLPSVFAACDDDGDDNPLGPTPDPVTGLQFDLRTDVGIFQLVHLQEQIEAAFYIAVVRSDTFDSMSAAERELLTDLRNVEVIHREFVRTALGANALPDIRGSINRDVLDDILSSRAGILQTAKMLEHNGVAGLNGTAKYIQDVRNLLVAGKLASVEARHAAALRDVLPPANQNANTSFAGDDIIDANGRDVKLEAQPVLQNALATGLPRPELLGNPPIAAPPTPQQGVPTPDFFPATV
ncbi:ferritin-like domain-containing protein [Longimicrobium sp.]|uniref:ferritin-like domain-containing protein n=1 Tax=Longimicrobium sp. TaxID=2029185 RepID=UPI003B3B6E5A